MPVTPLLSVPRPEYTSPGFVSPPGSTGAPAAGTTPGIINSIATPQAPAPFTPNTATPKDATSVGYTPEGFTVDNKQTVQGQVDDIIRKDSPLMQQAATRARQTSNARGMINSSMAVGAGQEAVISAALPIAQQDASTYSAAHTNTQNAKNAALNFDAAGKNQASQTNAQLGTNVSLANAESANKALEQAFQAQANYGLAGLDTNTKIALANLDTNTKVQLTQMENQNRQFLQANQDAASMFNQVATAIANISQNQNLDQDAKDDAIATQLNSLNEGLRLQGDIAGLDLGGYFIQGGGNLSNATSFSNLPVRTDIPNGGHRDARGNVYNADGSPAGWRGPEGADTYIGPTGTVYTDAQQWANAVNVGTTPPTGNTSAPATPRPSTSTPTQTAPTGTVTNPAQASGPRKLTAAEQINPNVIPWPGARWDNRSGWKV